MPRHLVTLIPSLHRFDASPKQSLLRAGLESGLNLKYGCEGGTCGECRARLVSGKIQSIKHSDFLFSAEHKADQYFLSCCHAAETDCQIEIAEIGSVHEIPEQIIEARVYNLQQLSEDVLAISLKTPRSQPLSFFAGQYVTLYLNENLQRNKSIASCPCDGLKPEIHVKFRAADVFSEYAFNSLKKNDRVGILGPLGNFVLDDDSPRPLIFIAYDTGFASIKSLLEHAIALKKEQSIRLYWLVTPHNTPYMGNYCRAIEDALDNFTYRPIAIREPSDECITAVLEKIVNQEKAIKHSDLFITLPEKYRELARARLVKSGIDDRQWSIDSMLRL